MNSKATIVKILSAGMLYVLCPIQLGNGRHAATEFASWNAASAWAASCAINADCDDGNECTENQCELGECASAVVPNGTDCDDADVCTRDDVCTAGLCEGSPTALGYLCSWALVLRQGVTGDSIRTGGASIAGDVCGGSIALGAKTQIDGDLVSSAVAGPKQIRLPSDAVISGDTVSGGAGVTSSSGSGSLPQLTAAASSLPPGSLTAKIFDGVYDLTGLHPLVSACADACVAGFVESTALLDSLPSSEPATTVEVGNGELFPIAATNPGSVNVVDFDSLTANSHSTIALDGGGHPGTVMVLRIRKSMKLRDQASFVLTGALSPENTLVYVVGRRCLISNLVQGAGSLFCPHGKVRVGASVSWAGAIFGSSRKLKIGHHSSLEYVPFLGL